MEERMTSPANNYRTQTFLVPSNRKTHSNTHIPRRSGSETRTVNGTASRRALARSSFKATNGWTRGFGGEPAGAADDDDDDDTTAGCDDVARGAAIVATGEDGVARTEGSADGPAAL